LPASKNISNKTSNIFSYNNNVKKGYRYIIMKKAGRNDNDDDVTISTSWETTTATPSSLSLYFYMKPEEELRDKYHIKRQVHHFLLLFFLPSSSIFKTWFILY
jgi:hypothetical protein